MDRAGDSSPGSRSLVFWTLPLPLLLLRAPLLWELLAVGTLVGGVPGGWATEGESSLLGDSAGVCCTALTAARGISSERSESVRCKLVLLFSLFLFRLCQGGLTDTHLRLCGAPLFLCVYSQLLVADDLYLPSPVSLFGLCYFSASWFRCESPSRHPTLRLPQALASQSAARRTENSCAVA